MNTSHYPEGTRVRGLFHGVEYTGTVTLCRPHKLHPTMVKMYVDFDTEIDCGEMFGKRTNGIITAHCDAICDHTIEAL